MKFRVALSDLEEARKAVDGALSGGGSDLSGHYLFRVNPTNPAKMEVLAYSGRLFAGAPFVADILETDGGNFTVEGWRLKMWLSVRPADSVLEFDSAVGGRTTLFVVSEPNKRMFFQGLDPEFFPYWDSMLSTAKSVCFLAPDRLKSALDTAKGFASTNETDNSVASVCVCEVRDGLFMSTNKSAAAMIGLNGMADSKLRIHVKDIGPVITFLGHVKAGDVEILEHDRAFFFRRGDGAFLAESRFNITFPALTKPGSQDQHWWVLPVDAISKGLVALASGADKLDTKVRISRPVADGPVVFSQVSVPGEMANWEVPCIESGKIDGAEPLPDWFGVRRADLQSLLAASQDENIRIGVNTYRKHGYLRFSHVLFAQEDGTGGDEYTIMVVWAK